MLKIIPMTEPQEQERLCLKCGIEYDKKQFSYGAYEETTPIGVAQFYIKENVGYITDLKIISGEAELMALTMLLGRSVLNFLDLHGVEEAIFEKHGDYYDKAAKVIGFKDKNGLHYAYLPGMFTAHEH